MTIADEIRIGTKQNRLHPLVGDNWASPRGLCNSSHISESDLEPQIVYCQLDYGHTGLHWNGPNQWDVPWPPPAFDHP
jgi:hypothetical protein